MRFKKKNKTKIVCIAWLITLPTFAPFEIASAIGDFTSVILVHTLNKYIYIYFYNICFISFL